MIKITFVQRIVSVGPPDVLSALIMWKQKGFNELQKQLQWCLGFRQELEDCSMFHAGSGKARQPNVLFMLDTGLYTLRH